MRILLDENVPLALAERIEGHAVDHVDQLGMKSVRNGELLAFARASYDLLITLDRGILYQHDHRSHRLGIVVLRVSNSRKETILARADVLAAALATMADGFRGEI